MQELKPIKEGKVREIYDNGDSLIMVATDRISCFDVILNNQVTKKGTVLTQMSKFWFDMTEDILPNHMISVDVKDMPEFFQQEKFDGNSMMCRKLEMLPIECIVRGYITGSGWESYKKTGKVCGIELPEGLKESDKLPEPIYTPSTKAEIGDHDENISYEQSIAHLEKYFPGRGEELAAKLRDNTIALYKKCAEYALSKGIIIADTKFEFGLDKDGNMVIGDEMLTPDSSRFWPAEGYEPGHGQPSFDKQFALTLTPMYLIFSKLGFLGNHLTAPVAIAASSIPFVIVTLRPYFRSIPVSLDEAARLDGCGSVKAFLMVMLPAVKTGIITIMVISFLNGWNDLVYSMTFNVAEIMRPLTANIYKFQSAYGTRWNCIMAYGAILVLPVILMFIFLQKYIVGGLVAGAVKD